MVLLTMCRFRCNLSEKTLAIMGNIKFSGIVLVLVFFGCRLRKTHSNAESYEFSPLAYYKTKRLEVFEFIDKS